GACPDDLGDAIHGVAHTGSYRNDPGSWRTRQSSRMTGGRVNGGTTMHPARGCRRPHQARSFASFHAARRDEAKASVLAVAQLKDGVAWRDAPQLLVRRVRSDALEEDADLGLPPLQVGPQQPRLLVVVELGCGEWIAPPAEQECALTAARTEVPHPLGLASRRHEVTLAFEGQRVDRHAPRLTARAAAHLEHARAEHTNAEPGEGRDDPVEHVPREPAGTQVTIRHAAHSCIYQL